MMSLSFALLVAVLAAGANASCSSHHNDCKKCTETTFRGVDLKQHTCKFIYVGPRTPALPSAFPRDTYTHACVDYLTKRDGTKIVNTIEMVVMTVKAAKYYEVVRHPLMCPKQNSLGEVGEGDAPVPDVVKQLRGAYDDGSKQFSSDEKEAPPRGLTKCQIIARASAAVPGMLSLPGLADVRPKISGVSMLPVSDVGDTISTIDAATRVESMFSVGDIPALLVSAGVDMYIQHLMTKLTVANARHLAVRSCFLMGCAAGTSGTKSITVNDPFTGDLLGHESCSLCEVQGLQPIDAGDDDTRRAKAAIASVATAVCPQLENDGDGKCWDKVHGKWGDFLGKWREAAEKPSKLDKLEKAGEALEKQVEAKCGGSARFRQSGAARKPVLRQTPIEA